MHTFGMMSNRDCNTDSSEVAPEIVSVRFAGSSIVDPSTTLAPSGFGFENGRMEVEFAMLPCAGAA